MIYLLTAIGFTDGGSSTVHIYIKTDHQTTKLTNLDIVNNFAHSRGKSV